jgi:hypothetical protein
MIVTAADAIDLLSTRLANGQFANGLCGYTRPQFAAEPACFALLALRSELHSGTYDDPVRALMRNQRPDGFWPAVDQDSGPGVWATAVAVNALIELSPGDQAVRSGIHALVNANPQEAHWLYRLKFRLIDTHVRFDPNKFGWGWVPGTISWVIPTSMALIVLQRSRRLNLIRAKNLERRLDLGYAMLFDRMCPGGGWNAGNSVVYEVALAPHIDATAIALAALRNQWGVAELMQSLSWLVGADCSSAFSLAWKILALRSYLDVRPDLRPTVKAAREQLISLLEDPAQFADTTTVALSILALRDDRNPFALEPA